MKMLKKAIDFFKGNPKVILIAGLAGIILIFASSFTEDKAGDNVTQTTHAITANEYARGLEQQLKSAVSRITGGDVSVMITLQSDIEYIYASEIKADKSSLEEQGNRQQSDDSNQSSVVIIKDENGNEKPLIVTAVMPQIKGVAVNCSGMGDERQTEQITRLVTTALGITESRVCVVNYN